MEMEDSEAKLMGARKVVYFELPRLHYTVNAHLVLWEFLWTVIWRAGRIRKALSAEQYIR